jgi:hypothetical protein
VINILCFILIIFCELCVCERNELFKVSLFDTKLFSRRVLTNQKHWA